MVVYCIAGYRASLYILQQPSSHSILFGHPREASETYHLGMCSNRQAPSSDRAMWHHKRRYCQQLHIEEESWSCSRFPLPALYFSQQSALGKSPDAHTIVQHPKLPSSPWLSQTLRMYMSSEALLLAWCSIRSIRNTSATCVVILV